MKALAKRLTTLEGGQSTETQWDLDCLSISELERLEVIVAAGERDEDIALSEADRAIIARNQPRSAG